MRREDSATTEVAVIGGGFFGAMIALHRRRAAGSPRVVLLEREPALLRRASYHNQARVHNGYHYPRSPRTALRFRVNFPRFVGAFDDCVVSTFEAYYAVARSPSKVTARQFSLFYERIGARIDRAPAAVRSLFHADLIEDVFAVRESAFDAAKLAAGLARELDEAGVEVRTLTDVLKADGLADGSVALACRGPEGFGRVVAGEVYHCAYSGLNRVLVASGLPPIPLKHELAEMALVRVPPALEALGITVMCGPFFSVMPFPPRGLHTLSHVRYTPHEAWADGGPAFRDPYAHFADAPRDSRFPHMRRDAARYVPALADAEYVDSLWEVKTVLPASEADDSRPILLRRHHGLPNFHCVLGAKIDNVFDALDEIDGDVATEARRTA